LGETGGGSDFQIFITDSNLFCRSIVIASEYLASF
jgi:hypothetical protein